MECDICHSWYCIECLEMPEALFDAISGCEDNMPHLMVPCRTCSATVPTLNSISQTMKKNQEKNEKHLEKIDQGMKDMEANLSKAITKSVKEEVKKQIGSQLKTQENKFDQKLAKVTNKMEEIESQLEVKFNKLQDCNEDKGAEGNLEYRINEAVREAVSENREIERRKNNIMFYNLDESKDENLQQRKTHDEKVVGEIVNKLLDGVPAEL